MNRTLNKKRSRLNKVNAPKVNRLDDRQRRLETRIDELTVKLKRTLERLETEISLREKVEESFRGLLYTFQGVIDSNDWPMFSVDTNFCYTSFNKKHQITMKALYGTEIELGHSILEYQTVEEDRIKTKSNLERAIKGASLTAEAYSGEDISNRRYFEVFHNPIRDNHGKVVGVAVSVRDLTERRRAEAALYRSENHFHNMFESHNAIMMLVEPESGNIIDANQAAVEFYGYSRQQLYTMQIQDINRLPATKVAALCRKTLNDRKGHFIFPHRLADGQVRWVEVYSTPVEVQGKILLFSIIHDISERKQAEEEGRRLLRQVKLSEARLHLALEAANSGVWEWDLNTNQNYLSKELWKLYGIEPNSSNHSGQVLKEIIHPDDRAEVVQTMLEAAERGTKINLEWRVCCSTGKIKWLMCRGQRQQGRNGLNRVIGIVMDITERKQIEDELVTSKIRLEQAQRESEERFNDLFQKSPGAIILHDGISLLQVNPAALTMLGYDQSHELLGFKVLDIVHPADRRKVSDRIHFIRENNVSKRTEEIRLLRKDGSIVYVEPVDGICHYRGRQVLQVIFYDFTERKQMEEALRESEERFRILVEALPQIVWVSDTKGNMEYFNSRFFDYTGLHPEECKYWGWIKCVHPEDVQHVVSYWSQALQTGIIYENEYRMRHFNGEYRWFLSRGIPIRDGDGKICRWFGTRTEIHYQKQLEKDLQESNLRLQELNKQIVTMLEEERSAISRELHDEAGQALTALKIFLELLRDKSQSEACQFQSRINEATQLTTATLEKIRHLAHNLHPPALDALGLNLTLKDFCYEFGKRVGLHIEYQGCELPTLSGTAGICLYRFLQEALTNVVKHARADQVLVRLDYQERQISLFVSDNGIGFQKKDMKQIKGIGLSGMEERLKMIGGVLTINSIPGQGTSLIASIPWEVNNDPNLDSRRSPLS